MQGMTDEGRKDLDRLVIRMGGRDYKVANLVGGGLLLLAGLGVLAYGLANPAPGVWLGGGLLILFGLGVLFGRAS